MGVGVAFLSFFTSLFIQKRKDEEEKKGGVSDGGEADFQTQPPTLITYPRCFYHFILIIYIYIEKMVGVGFSVGVALYRGASVAKRPHKQTHTVSS